MKKSLLHISACVIAVASASMATASTTAPVKFPAAEDPMITERPEGVSTIMSGRGMSYVVSWSGITTEEYCEKPSEFIEDGNGNIYISNILSNTYSPGWVKGTIDGDKITIPVPQTVDVIPFGEDTFYYQIDVLKYIDGKELDNYAFEVDESVSAITMTKTAEGSWHLDLPDNGSVILGLTDPYSDLWIGYADVLSYWDKAPWVTATPPEGSKFNTYAMRYGEEGRVLNVIHDGEDIYMQNLSSYSPKAWVKGKCSGETVSFPSNQLLGVSGSDFIFFQGSIYTTVVDEYDGYEYQTYVPIEEAVFSYDKDSDTMQYVEEGAVLVNAETDVYRSFETYWMPSIYPQPKEIVEIPQKPSFVDFTSYSPELGYGSFSFGETNLNADGYVLDRTRMYFRVSINGEYLQCPNPTNGDSTLFPYGFCDYEIVRGYPGVRQVNFSTPDFEKAIVTQVYIDADGNEVPSEDLVIDANGNSGVSEIEMNTVERTSYFDLSGRRISGPTKGIYIMRQGDKFVKCIGK